MNFPRSTRAKGFILYGASIARVEPIRMGDVFAVPETEETMIARMAVFAGLVMSLSVQAHAMCKDDIQDLLPRVNHAKAVDLQRYALVEKWYGRALEVEPDSEIECLNFIARAKKALEEPLPATADCTGPNANTPQCQGGAVGGGFGGAIPPFGVAGVGGAGGGGMAPAAAQPAAPVTAGNSAPFTPPSSVGAPGRSPQ
jgi:hypothetical protein